MYKICFDILSTKLNPEILDLEFILDESKDFSFNQSRNDFTFHGSVPKLIGYNVHLGKINPAVLDEVVSKYSFKMNLSRSFFNAYNKNDLKLDHGFKPCLYMLYTNSWNIVDWNVGHVINVKTIDTDLVTMALTYNPKKDHKDD